MAKDAGFELATPFKVYFCNPHLPWEHPSNEDVNGLIERLENDDDVVNVFHNMA